MRGKPREQIVHVLTHTSQPMTAQGIADRLGRTTGALNLTLAVMALEGRIVKQRVSGAAWYGRSWQVFHGRVYHLQSQKPENRGERGWVTFRMLRTELAARQEGKFYARCTGQAIRLVHRGQILSQWNEKEESQWRAGRETLSQLRKILRDRSHSQREAFTQALTLRP